MHRTAEAIVNGLNMGMTLSTVLIALAVILWSTVEGLRAAQRLDFSTPSIVCQMSVLIAMGSMIFSVRRVMLISANSPLFSSQPTWSMICVIIGSGMTTAALCLSLVWRARRRAPGSERKVSALLGAAVVLCVIGGAYAL